MSSNGEVVVPKFKVGDRAVVILKGKAENGLTGVIKEVQDYDGPRCLDSYMYLADWFSGEALFVRAFFPERWLGRCG